MTKQQKVTIAVLGPLAMVLSLTLVIIWPFFATHDTRSPEAASAQTAMIASQAVANAVIGQGGNNTKVLTSWGELIDPDVYQLHCMPTIVNCCGTVIKKGNPAYGTVVDTNFPGATCSIITQGTSIINNVTGSYIHFADDLQFGDAVGGGCGPCGTTSGTPGTSATLPALFLHRQHRMVDLGPISSFGPGVFSNYDVKILVEQNSVEVFDPAALDTRLLGHHGNGLYKDFMKTIKDVQLYDAQGNATGVLDHADKAVLHTMDGRSFAFGFLAVASGGGGGGGGQNWQLNTAYDVGVVVTHVGTQYQCTLAHTSDSSTEPGVGLYWGYTWAQVGGGGGGGGGGVTSLDGRLTRITDANGYELVVTYKSWTAQEIDESPERQWQIDTVTDAYGRTATFYYHPQQVAGRWVVSQIDVPGGGSLQYTYTNGELTGVTHPDGSQSTFTFTTTTESTTIDFFDAAADGTHRRKKVNFRNMTVYDPTGVTNVPTMQVAAVQNGAGEISYANYVVEVGGSKADVFVYEGSGRLKKISVGSNDVGFYKDGWSVQEGTGQHPLKNISGSVEDSYVSWTGIDINRPTVLTDEQGATRNFQYDSEGRQTRIDYSDGSFETFAYNALSQVTRYRDREGNVSLSTYDAKGNQLTRELGLLDDGMGGQTQQPEYAMYQWQYFAAGHQNQYLLSAEIDANGNQTDYEYDGNNRLIKIIQPADAAGSPRAETVYTYNTLGLLASETDPAGRVTSYEYDSRHRLVKTIHNDGSTERNVYGSGDDANLVIKQVDRNGVVTEYEYDLAGRRTKTILAAATMDANGNETAITDPLVRTEEVCTYLIGTDDRESCTRAGDTTQYTYDYRGRVASTTVHPRVGVTLTSSNAYRDNQLFYQEDPYGRRTYFAYRAADGALIRRVQGTVPGFEAEVGGGGSSGGGGGGGPTPWQSGTMYAVGNLVTHYMGAEYECIASHLSGSDSEPAFGYNWQMYWTESTGGGGPAGWQSGTFYNVSDVVTQNGDTQYECSSSHTSDIYSEPGVGPYWNMFWTQLAGGGGGGGGGSGGGINSFVDVLALTRGVDPEPNGKLIITDYVLDDAGNTIETIDGRGISHTSAYDSRDRVVEQVQAAGTPVAAKTETVYDANGNVIEVRSPRYFDANDTNGYQKSRTTMTYNGRNRLASRTEAPGMTEAGTEQYSYTVDGRLDTRTDARGNDWQTIYHACCGRTQATVDPLGHGTITNNDYRGNVTHQVTVSDVASHTNYHDPDDTKTLGEVTTRYDERGRPIARTIWLVPLAVVDPNNVPIAGLAGVPSSDGLTQRWFYDDDLDDGQGLDAGITVAKIDGSGSFTLSIASLIAELSADGTDLGATAGSSSSADGSATVTLNGEDEISVSISDGAGRSVAQGILEQSGTAITWSTIQHDTIANIANFGDVLETARHDALNHITRSRTDGAGRTIESVDAETFVSTFSSDANGNQVSVRDPNNVGQDCTFDALNRDVSCTDTQGDATSKVYDLASNIIKTIDAKSAETLCSFDARNRQVQCTNRIGSVTQWGYDANGNLLSLLDGDNHDANGDATLYTYDARNLKTSEAFPGHGPTSSIGDADYDLVAFTYDPARRITVKTDQQGDTATHNYDLAGRLTSRAYQGGPNSPLFGQSDTDTFVYDAAGRITSATSGRYNNVVAMGYDNASRLVSESLTAYGQTYTVGSGFDAANRKTSITYPDGKVVSRGYTARDQLASIVYDASPIDTRTYDNGGRLATSLYGNGIGTTWSYRNDNLVSSITRTNLTGADFNYTYDANKNKTTETISGVMAPYGFNSTGYDSQDRLTAWNRTDGALNQSWNLSKEGDWNSFTENGTTESRSHTEVHELTSINTTPLAYDAKGNLTQNSNGQTYTWDFDNRMRAATVPVGATEGMEGTHFYIYDALGRRVSKSVGDGGTTTTIVFLIITERLEQSAYAGRVVSEYAAGAVAASPDRSFVYGTYVDEPVLLVDAPGATEQLYYYHANSLHSVAATSNNTGGVVERYGYAAYGSATICDSLGVPTGSQSTVGNPYTFTGRTIDTETRLYYYRARYYDARLGRFLSSDPIGYGGSQWNLYEYVDSAPTNALDPSGLGFGGPVTQCVLKFVPLLGRFTFIGACCTYKKVEVPRFKCCLYVCSDDEGKTWTDNETSIDGVPCPLVLSPGVVCEPVGERPGPCFLVTVP